MGLNVIRTGDLNCDILNRLHNNKQGKCDIYDLDSLIIITSPAIKDFQKHSFLPGCHPNKCPSHSGVIETGRSDHCLIYAVLNTKLKTTIRTPFVLSIVPFSVAYTFDDPDHVYSAGRNFTIVFLMTMHLFSRFIFT